MRILVTVSLAIFGLGSMVGCGGEAAEFEVEGEVETLEQAARYVSPAYRFKNAASSTCIESNPMGLATCSSSSSQKIEWVLKTVSPGTYRYYWWLRFKGTNQCLYATSDKDVIKKTCSTKKDKFFWSPISKSGGRYAFTSMYRGRCLKVSSSGALRAGSCKGTNHKWYLQ